MTEENTGKKDESNKPKPKDTPKLPTPDNEIIQEMRSPTKADDKKSPPKPSKPSKPSKPPKKPSPKPKPDDKKS